MKDGAYKLKEAATVAEGMSFKAGQDFEVVNNVVYVDGYPLPPHMQRMYYMWILNNMNLFLVDSRTY